MFCLSTQTSPAYVTLCVSVMSICAYDWNDHYHEILFFFNLKAFTKKKISLFLVDGGDDADDSDHSLLITRL